LSVRIGINGLGRIGRTLFRLVSTAPDIQVAGINDVASPEILAHLLLNDSVAGRWSVPVEGRESSIVASGRVIPCSRHAAPDAIPWGDWGVEIVVEATGLFRQRAAAVRHLQSGVRQVIISAPSPDADRTIVWGINQTDLDPTQHRIVSAASCTTQCAAPLIRIADEAWGVEACSMTTIHCYTNGQPLMDAPQGDLRRSRAAGMSMIPTSTSASKALQEIFPDLASRISCLAVRVPTPFVSAVDLVVALKRETDLERARERLRTAQDGSWQGIVGYTEEDLVSVDFRGDSRSAIVDGHLLALPSPRLLKIYAWYDNESGYSHRLLDLIRHLASSAGDAR